MDDLLFYRGGELRQALAAQGEKMRQAVEGEDAALEVDADAVHVTLRQKARGGITITATA